jgi:hypothetical protein
LTAPSNPASPRASSPTRSPLDPDGHAEDEDLRRWVERGLAYASSLPSK